MVEAAARPQVRPQLGEVGEAIVYLLTIVGSDFNLFGFLGDAVHFEGYRVGATELTSVGYDHADGHLFPGSNLRRRYPQLTGGEKGGSWWFFNIKRL